MGITRPRTRRGVALIAAAAALTAVIATPAGAGVDDNKTYTVDIDGTTAGAAPAAWAGDTNATIDVVITNTGPSQSLGSVNLTLPAPFALVSAPADAVPGGPVVELRNLNLAPNGGSVTVALTVDVRSCAASAGTAFGANAKQSNDYNGTGNDFFLQTSASDLLVATTGACQLAFLAPPADAETGKVVTSVDWTPAGAPVTVEVLDAGSTGRIGSSTPLSAPVVLGFGANPGSATLGGTTSAAPVAGVASFAPTVNVSAFDYTLVASSTGLVSSLASPTFDIVDDHATCPAGGACEPATASKNGQTATANFGSAPTSNDLLVSLGAADAPTFECTNYPKAPGTLVSQFLFSTEDENRVGTFTGTIPNATKPLNEYEVCWAAPYDFMTESGLMASVEPDLGDGTLKPGTTDTLNVGILPDCPKRGTVTPPCVLSRSYQKSTKTVTITVRADGRDPFKY